MSNFKHFQEQAARLEDIVDEMGIISIDAFNAQAEAEETDAPNAQELRVLWLLAKEARGLMSDLRDAYVDAQIEARHALADAAVVAEYVERLSQ